jgi:hypothetical protein
MVTHYTKTKTGNVITTHSQLEKYEEVYQHSESKLRQSSIPNFDAPASSKIH